MKYMIYIYVYMRNQGAEKETNYATLSCCCVYQYTPKAEEKREEKGFQFPSLEASFPTHASNMTTAIMSPSQLKTEQEKKKNARKDLQLFQKMVLKYVKQSSDDCQNARGFLFLPSCCIVSSVLGSVWGGSIGISGFLFHHETLAQEILIVDPCGQDLEILPSQGFLVPECSWNWLWLPVTWLLYPSLFSLPFSGVGNGLEG